MAFEKVYQILRKKIYKWKQVADLFKISYFSVWIQNGPLVKK